MKFKIKFVIYKVWIYDNERNVILWETKFTNKVCH